MARILIVDDEESIRALLRETLAMHDHSVETANDGVAALGLIRKNDYDLVIMDRNMPEMGGIDAIRILRTNPKFKDLKILMFTSASVTKEVDEAFAVGANGYLVKPLDIYKFLAKVQAALGQ